MTRLDLVLPLYDEAEALEPVLARIRAVLAEIPDLEWRILLVDDGSRDTTAEIAARLAEAEPRVVLIVFTRNFGKEAAILAGLEASRGEVVLVMDADLQHPPELIPQMLALWRGGARVVEGTKRTRGRESPGARLGAYLFYRLFTRFSGLAIQNATDFKLLDRQAVDAYCALPERNRFFRGLIPWLGLPTAQVPFDVPPRSHGSPSWSRLRLGRLAVDALSAFTSAPLQVITLVGGLVFLTSLILGGIALYQKFAGIAVSGFTTVILLLLLLGSALMFSLGVLGTYVARIYEEVKGRPCYLVDRERSRGIGGDGY